MLVAPSAAGYDGFGKRKATLFQRAIAQPSTRLSLAQTGRPK